MVSYSTHRSSSQLQHETFPRKIRLIYAPVSTNTFFLFFPDSARKRPIPYVRKIPYTSSSGSDDSDTEAYMGKSISPEHHSGNGRSSLSPASYSSVNVRHSSYSSASPRPIGSSPERANRKRSPGTSRWSLSRSPSLG